MLIIDNINFNELETEKYWTFPKTFKGDKRDEIKKMIFSNEYIGSLKVDGYYYRLIKDLDGEIYLQPRNRNVKGEFVNKAEWVPQLNTLFKKLPNGTCLLGEIFIPAKEISSEVTKIMGCTLKNALSRQEKLADLSKPHYYIFDIWAWDGESYLDKAIVDRIKPLKEIESWRGNRHSYFFTATYRQGEALWGSLSKYLSEGKEGIVMTKIDSKPTPGKRPARKTLKVKKEINQNIDCFFTGKFTKPKREYTGKKLQTWEFWEDDITGQKIKGKKYIDYVNGAAITPVTQSYFYNWAGSLEIGLLDNNTIVPIGYISGVPNDWKKDPASVKNMVVEVSSMEILATGGLRHAKIERIRDDLTPNDCTMDKVCK